MTPAHEPLLEASDAQQKLEILLNIARTLDEAQSTVPHLGQMARTSAALGNDEETATLRRHRLAEQELVGIDAHS